MAHKDRHLPFPPDPQQLEELDRIREEGCVIASEGTDRYELLEPLVDQEILNRHHCPAALGVYQYTMKRTPHDRSDTNSAGRAP